MRSEAAKAIIGAAVIDDVLGLVALSLTQQVAAGTLSAAHGAQVAATAFGFMRSAGWLFHRIPKTAPIGGSPFFLQVMYSSPC